MIAFNNKQNETTWQLAFVAMMPEIQQKLRLAFCRLDPEAREDAIEEGVVHSLLVYLRLHEQGRAEAATGVAHWRSNSFTRFSTCGFSLPRAGRQNNGSKL